MLRDRDQDALELLLSEERLIAEARRCVRRSTAAPGAGARRTSSRQEIIGDLRPGELERGREGLGLVRRQVFPEREVPLRLTEPGAYLTGAFERHHALGRERDES